MPDDSSISPQPTPTPVEPVSSAPEATNTPTMPPEATEAPRSPDAPAEVNNQNQASSTPVAEGGQVAETAQSVPTPTQQTAQITPNEPNKLSLLARARLAIQFRKQKKLNKILNMFTAKQKITNDEVEKLLHVSDATATRYLETLKKQGKIMQLEKTGKGVTYIKI